MKSGTWITITGVLLALLPASSPAQSVVPANRGRLLYDNHCIACHDRQVHWREARAVTDWATLVAQVRRWQAIEKLQWTDSDILQVARHLNGTIYGFPAQALARRE
ncbi:cytochrome C [Comamonadaceae bacterium G21597-S1]|nr:cytochrome C [Comamonadaceae bacterium G21597-S1]